MDFKNLTGWGQALFAVLVLWSISNVFLGYTIRVWDVHPIVYSCVVFTSASFALLLYSGHGKLARETVRSIDTWGYGISLMLNYIVLLALLALITSTEATLLQSVAVPISLLAGWFFIGRSVSRTQVMGAVVIAVGLTFVFYDLAADDFGYTVLLVIAMGVIQTIRTYVAEFHRPHKFATTQSGNVKDRSRVVALVMFVVSTLFFICFLGFAILMHFVQGVHVAGFPILTDFFNPYTTLFGMIAGLILIAPLRFFEFSATSAIKSENYLAVSSFAPIATWFWEYLSQPLTGVDIRALTHIDALACGLITLGGLIIAAGKMRAVKAPHSEWKKYLACHIQSLSQIQDSREIASDTLQHFSGSLSKAAKALDIPEEVLNVLLLDEDKVLSFHEDVLNRIYRNYRKNVASCDALTGLLNRAGFTSEFNAKISHHERATILFIDLNKFKPVNDTYGHEAGDFILHQTGKRLRHALPAETSLITRLGGDEFVIALFDCDDDQATIYTAQIQALLAYPFECDGHDIQIGGSIGRALYPDHGDVLDDLLKHADEAMYEQKSER